MNDKAASSVTGIDTARHQTVLLFFLSLAALSGVSSTVHAQSSDASELESIPASGDEPWAEGVSQRDQERAHTLFLEGNRFTKELLFKKAAERYEQALALLEHPAILFNLAIAQVNQGQTDTAYEYLERALSHGQAPIGEIKYEQGVTLRKALESQLARIEVACEMEDSEITLDNRVLFTGPGRQTLHVKAGPHRVVATRPGHLPDIQSLALSPGQSESIVLKPTRIVDKTARVEQMMPPWIPWTVTASGAFLVAGGGLLDARAASTFQRFDDDFTSRCGGRGCADSEVGELNQVLDSARRQRFIAFALYGVGSASFITGTVLLFLNRKRVVLEERDEPTASAGTFAIQPVWSRDGVGVQVHARF